METATSQTYEGKPVDIFYLDFQKAFDKVPHMRLLKKLGTNEISGRTNNWVSDWLNN